MKTKQFTTMQLFSIADNNCRLSTSIEDVYLMLNHIFDTSLYTRELPRAVDKLREINPDWYEVIRQKVSRLTFGLSFEDAIKVIEQNNETHTIPQLSKEQIADFKKMLLNG